MPERPIRLTLSRRKGFSLAEAAKTANSLPVQVVTRATKWGNPYVVGQDGSRKDCADKCEHLVEAALRSHDYRAPTRREQAFVETVRRDIHELAGRNLACVCPPGGPCHADALLAAANRGKTA